MSLKKQSLFQRSSTLSEYSLSGKKWYFPSINDNELQHLINDHDIPEVIARILKQLNIHNSHAELFLDPKLRTLLPDPFCLRDMEKGVRACMEAIAHHKKIAIFGDYDVDGATSSALLRRYFRDIGIVTELYIPDRLGEGYGPSIEAMKTLHSKGIKLILMVDCGTLAFAPLEAAHAMGMKVVVLDHHLSDNELPIAEAIINPNRLDENPISAGYLKELCAVGVSFLFLVALQKRLRTNGFFEGRTEPDLLQFLDFVALGTVCDVMPLTHLNRVFVTHGLKLIAKRSNPGIASLMDIAGCGHVLPTAYHLGFVVGPRVNAGGRVGESWLGSQLLFSEDVKEIKETSKKLHYLNQERQTLEKNMIEQAYALVEKNNLCKRPVILISHDDWHPGIIGIAASRLKERYHKPVLVISHMQDAMVGKGSGRSVLGASLGEAMHEAVKRKLLIHGGGHAMAAGFTIHRHMSDAFYDFLCDYLGEAVDAYVPSLTIAGWLSLSSLHPHLVKSLSILEPFGQGNPTPKFAIGPVAVRFVDVFGTEHIRLTLEDAYGHRIRAVHFRGLIQPYADALMKCCGLFHFAGSLKYDSWNGKEDVSFIIEDAMSGG